MKFLYSQKTKPNFFDFRTIKKKKNLVKLYREPEVTPPPPSTVEKKILKRFKRKVERNDDITYTQKNQIFLTRKITVRCSIKKKRKKKEIICDVLLS